MQGQTAQDFFTFEAVKDEKTCMALITLQPLSKSGVMPQMKAMYILFHMLYGRLMCCQRLQSDRPK